MPIPLHDHFTWTPRARREFDQIADAYRSRGREPWVLSICWATVRLNAGGAYQAPFLGYYCTDETDGVPADEIGIIDGVKCVFFLLDDAKKRFWGKVLDWDDTAGWVLRNPPAGNAKAPGA